MMLRGNVNALQRDLVADHDCPVDGTTLVHDAISDWKTWALAQGSTPIDLHMPAAPVSLLWDVPSYLSWSNDVVRPFGGIKRLRVYGNGVTINSTDGQCPAFGMNPAMDFNETRNAVGAPIATVLEGSFTVTVSDIDHASRFSVGQWVMISALDIMGFGWPINNYFWEYNEVTAINGAVISLARPTRNTYKDTYPQYSGALELDQGGPAKIWPMLDGWGDTDHTYYDINIDPGLNQQYAAGRRVRYIRCTATGVQSPIPTQNMVWEAILCYFSSTTEVDKMIDLVRIKKSYFDFIEFQSASIRDFDADGISGIVHGTAQHNWIRNPDLTLLRIGPSGYGDSQTIRVDGGSIAEITSGGGQMAWSSLTGVTKTDGVITWPKSNGVPTWAIPGRAAVMMYGTSTPFAGAFNVLDVADAGSNVLITTDQPGGFPSHWPGDLARFGAHPCLDVRFQNVTGCIAALSLSHASAQGRPLWSSFYQHCTGNTFPTEYNNPLLWGELVEMRINVTQAYTGSQETLTLYPTGANGFTQAWAPGFADFASGWAPPLINLKIAGERVITPGGVTGAQSGDSLSAPGVIVFYGAPSPRVSAVISGEASNLWPIVEITVLTDQGV